MKQLDLNNYHERELFLKRTPWKRTRREKLSLNPFCEICSSPGRPVLAQEVDHIEPIEVIVKGLTLAEAYEAALDIDNLQSLCKSCHSKKTYKEKLYGAWQKSRNVKPKEVWDLDKW